MELYTISPNNHRRETLIENYESYIWTERFASYGDFQLVTNPTPKMVARLRPGVLIGGSESKHVMQIRETLRTEDPQGKATMTVTGVSLEAMLQERIVRHPTLNRATWEFIRPATTIATLMVDHMCVRGQSGSPLDVIPHLTAPLAKDSSPNIRLSVKRRPLYDQIKELADAHDFGFRITKPALGSPVLKYESYRGKDRSGPNGIVFSPELESLSGISYLDSQADYKNVAYVEYSDDVVWMVYAPNQRNVQGLDRRVIFVDGTDIRDLTGKTLEAALNQRGLDALSQHKAKKLLDGVVNPNAGHRYGTHYFMGDIVRLVGYGGESQRVRVTEHIWSGDSSGITSYPTLSEL